MNNKLVSLFGNRAAVFAAVETILFAVSLIVGLTIKYSIGMIAGYIICIFLAATAIVMMAAAYMRAPDARRILGLLALSSAIVYAALCMSTYFIQLAVVAPNSFGFSPGVLGIITFVPGAPLFALYMLGYVFLCLSTLATNACCTSHKRTVPHIKPAA
jgi:hypothetical protein